MKPRAVERASLIASAAHDSASPPSPPLSLRAALSDRGVELTTLSAAPPQRSDSHASLSSSSTGSPVQSELLRRSARHTRSTAAAAATAVTAAKSGAAVQSASSDEESVTIVHAMQYFRFSALRNALFVVICVLSAGLAFLVSRWAPVLEVYGRRRPCMPLDADAVRVRAGDGTWTLCPVHVLDDDGQTWREAARGADMQREARPRMIEFRFARFLLDEDEGVFERVPPSAGLDETGDGAATLGTGLVHHSWERTRMLAGRNLIDVRVPSAITLLLTEALNPFYIFQLFSFGVWMSEGYYYYCAAIIIMASVSLGVEVAGLRRNWARLSSMAVVKRDVHVLRDAAWSTVCSSELVPGDIVQVEAGMVLPFDGMLMAGSAVVNEAMLTGESVPVVKAQLASDAPAASAPSRPPQLAAAAAVAGVGSAPTLSPSAELPPWMRSGLSTPVTGLLPPLPPGALGGTDGAGVPDAPPSASSALAAPRSGVLAVAPAAQPQPAVVADAARLARSGLFCGTEVLQVRAPRSGPGSESHRALARVTRTGFNTAKGELVRSILFPKPTHFHFYRDSMRFVFGLGAIALIGMIYSFIEFAQLGVEPGRMVQRALDLCTIVVPPALPACLTIGTGFAIMRLAQQRISCIAPVRVNVAGNLDVFCFDKTGTLTDDGLDLEGVQPVVPARARHHTGALSSGGSSGSNSASASASASGVSSATASALVSASASSASVSNLSAAHDFGALARDVVELPRVLVHLLATCHSLSEVEVGSITGDPLEVKMLAATRWSLFDPESRSEAMLARWPAALPPLSRDALSAYGAGDDDVTLVVPPRDCAAGTPALVIERRLEYSSAFARMGVLVSELGGGAGSAGSGAAPLSLFVKGAPEVVRGLCRADSVPANFDRVVQDHARRGLRVLACAMRTFDAGADAAGARVAPRDALERDLVLVGLLVMENKLKPESRPALEQLSGAGLHCVMITGDHVLTAICVARNCALVHRAQRLVLCEIDAVDTSRLRWTVQPSPVAHHPRARGHRRTASSSSGGASAAASAPAADSSATVVTSASAATAASGATAVDAMEHGEHAPSGHVRSGSSVSDASAAPSADTVRDPECVEDALAMDKDTVFAITGRAFALLQATSTPDEFQRVCARGVVFARMSPAQKAQLVELYAGMGAIVGMCGDGANDCSALKAAHVGLSLSTSDASIAAPFTSAVPNISAAVELVRQGRCALMTSVQSFKFMVVYSVLQFLAVTILYSVNSNYGDQMYLWDDLFLVLPLTITMARTQPYAELVAARPLTELFSLPIFVSVLGTIVAQFAVMLGAFAWLVQQAFYVPLVPDPLGNNYVCMETSTVFLVNAFQYVFVCLAFNMGHRFRRAWFTNIMLVVALVVAFALNTVLTMVVWSGFELVFTIDVRLPFEFRWQLMILALANGAATIVYEYIALGVGCARGLRRRVRRVVRCERLRHRRRLFKVFREPLTKSV